VEVRRPGTVVPLLGGDKESVSIPIVAVFVLGYLAMIVVVLALMRSAKHADARAEREHEALVRSLSTRRTGRFAEREDPARERVPLRRIG
jgi:hypothetical protein